MSEMRKYLKAFRIAKAMPIKKVAELIGCEPEKLEDLEEDIDGYDIGVGLLSELSIVYGVSMLSMVTYELNYQTERRQKNGR